MSRTVFWGQHEQQMLAQGTPLFRTAVGICFCLGSLLGNVCNIDMFFGVNFLFGSIFVWLAMITLGPTWAVAAAIAGGLYTVALWGHWCAAIIFALEAAVVSALCRLSSASHFSALVLVFWLFIGAPIGFYLYSEVLGLPSETVFLVVAKQALNGMLNAMIAALIVTSILFFFPKVQTPRSSSDASSYSELLQAIFGLAFLMPILLSEFAELRGTFQRGVEYDLARSEVDIRRSAKNISSFLKLETVFWGGSIVNSSPEEIAERIQHLMNADTSASPSQIFRVLGDGSLRLIYGSDHSWKQITGAELDHISATETPMGYLLGCHGDRFTSLYVSGSGVVSFAFVWSDQAIKSSLYSPRPEEAKVKCKQKATEGGVFFGTTSVDLVREVNPSISALKSWLEASITARTVWGSLSSTVLEVSHSLKPNVLKVQRETFTAVKRLCILAMLVVLGGQILDILFRKWVGKFVHISEAYLKHRKHAPHCLNNNFKEDRTIKEWLERFSKAVEHAELSKWKAQRNFRLLLTQASTPVFATNTQGQIKVWNPALQELTGYCEDEVLGKPASDFLEGSTDMAMDDVKPNFSERLFDVPTKSGSSVHLVVSQLRIEKPETTLHRDSSDDYPSNESTDYFIAQNLSELRESQARIIHASRLAALGEMAGSFAHELNQPLNVIALSAGSLLERAKAGDVPREYLTAKSQRIESQALRAGEIIQEIRKFILKDDESDVTDFDPVATTQTALDLVKEQLRIENVAVEINVACEKLGVRGRSILFEQAIVNLLINANQALKEVAVNDRRLCINFTATASEITILMQDTGPGIPTDHLRRVFVPFFTTKKKYGGSGIGLYMTKQIVLELGGSIRALKVKRGACFEINLPIAELQGGE